MPDPRFAFITLEDGRTFQVLRYQEDPETGEQVPVDWDEEATARLVQAALDE